MAEPTSNASPERFREVFHALKQQLGRRIVGCGEILENVLLGFFAGGHLLLESGPGLGKTLIVKTLAECLDLQFARIQFTPDLMPADIVGTNVILEVDSGRRSFQFQPGPVFTQILMADEITRATPKTQAALLESMQERRVTTGGKTYPLPSPFFVLATQSPPGTEGTYPLPEAQMDRFLFQLEIGYPGRDDLKEIGRRTAEDLDARVEKVLAAAEALDLQKLVRAVPVSDPARDYAIRLVLGTNVEKETAVPIARKYLRYGSSPRGAQGLLLAAKAWTLVQGRPRVEVADVRRVLRPVLRHRLILNFEGQAENVSPDDILQHLLDSVAA